MVSSPEKFASDWTRFRKELCRSCWASCCHGMPVEVSVPDLIRMGYLTAREASGSLARVAGRLRKEGVIRHFEPGPLTFLLEQKPGGDCIFLDSARRCTIYANRPAICRSFPRIGPRPGYCPYKKKKDTK